MADRTLNAVAWEIKRQAKAAFLPALLLVLTGVFAWQATQGDHGLIMRALRETQLRQAESNFAAARVERETWKIKVAGLMPAHIDRDALDQRAREMLNLADPGEIIVQYPTRDKLF